MKRREVKSKGEKERYKHLNAEFQRIARRDKKAFFSDQCKEIEENNSTSRIPPQLEQNHVVLPSSQDEALARYSVSSRNKTTKSCSCEFALWWREETIKITYIFMYTHKHRHTQVSSADKD